MTDMRDKYGRYAVVTGASAGIGAEFATQLAANGLDLVLVARRKEKLQALADQLRAEYGTTTEVIELDLGGEGAVSELLRRTSPLDVGMVVASAGVATAGPFLDTPLADESALIDLDLSVPMQLTHQYGRLFRTRGRGALILLSSAVAFAAVPYMANYSAAKAYVANFGLALRHELKPSGVDVLVLAPGPTRTEGFDNTEGIDFARLPMPALSAQRVVGSALRGLGRKPLVIPGLSNGISDVLGKHLIPRRIQTIMFGSLVRRALVTKKGDPEATASQAVPSDQPVRGCNEQRPPEPGGRCRRMPGLGSGGPARRGDRAGQTKTVLGRRGHHKVPSQGHARSDGWEPGPRPRPAGARTAVPAVDGSTRHASGTGRLILPTLDRDRQRRNGGPPGS